jgi:hypothetical protein
MSKRPPERAGVEIFFAFAIQHVFRSPPEALSEKAAVFKRRLECPFHYAFRGRVDRPVTDPHVLRRKF